MRVRSRLGSLRLGFSAYSRPQLTEIITERLRHIDAFEKSAIEYASAAIAVFSGDARRALRICRYANLIFCSLPMVVILKLANSGGQRTLLSWICINKSYRKDRHQKEGRIRCIG